MSTVDMGHLVVRQDTFLRDESGRFLAEFHEKCSLAAFTLAEMVARWARVYAPFRKGTLKASIRPFSTGGTSAAAVADAPHAAPQEFGAGPHPIGDEGQALGNREEGFFAKGPVAHPGNPATFFLERAGAAVAPLAAGVVAEIIGE